MKRVWIIFGAAGLIVVICLLARPSYKRWKERHFTAAAAKAYAKRDYREAVTDARKVLEVNPANLIASRIMADVTEQLKIPEALFWRHRILLLEPNRVENRLELARAALVLGNRTEAEAALRGVPEAGRNRVDFHELVAMLDAQGQNLSAAEAQAAAALKLEPQNKGLQMNLAILQIQSKNKQTVDAAKNTLLKLSGEPQLRREALRQLAMWAGREKNYTTAARYSGQLLELKPPAFEDQLMDLDIARDGNFKNFGAKVAAVENSVVDSPEKLNALAGWLSAHHLTDEALRWLQSLPPKIRDGQAAQVPWRTVTRRNPIGRACKHC